MLKLLCTLIFHTDEYNIAFAAALGNVQDVGPFNTEVTLVYNKVYVNAGLHYNPGTGMWFQLVSIFD